MRETPEEEQARTEKARQETLLTGPWCAWTQPEVRDDKGRHMVAYVEADSPGYWATTYTGDYEYVLAVAAEINKTLGVDEDEQMRIVTSSMSAPPRRHT